MPHPSPMPYQKRKTTYIIDFLRYFLPLSRVHLVLLYVFRSDAIGHFGPFLSARALGVHTEEAILNS